MASEKQIHTKHGAVYANKLLERSPDNEYVEEWTNLLAREQEPSKELTERALLLFRLGKEWLGLSAKYLVEVCEEKIIHRIPHKNNPILKGLVNLKGQLRICVSLQKLLEIESVNVTQKNVLTYNRMLAIHERNDVWIFPVDEVYGIYHFDINELKNPPVTVSKSSSNYLRGIIAWRNINVGYLDEELIFASLERSIV